MTKIFYLFACLFLTIGSLFAQERSSDIIFKDNFEMPSVQMDAWHITNDPNSWELVSKNKFPSDIYSINIQMKTRSADSSWMMINSHNNKKGRFLAYDCRLVSPRFDLSKQKEVYLKFDNLFRKGEDDHVSIEISTDSIDWSNRIELYEDLKYLEFPNLRQSPFKVNSPFQVILDLTPFAANKKKVWIAFHYEKPIETEGIGWQIDNVELWESDPTSKCDIALLDDGYAIPQIGTPIGQQELIPFAASVVNKGAEKVKDAKLEIRIFDASNKNLIWSDELSLGDLDFEKRLENQLFTKGFIPNNNTKSYIGEYKLSATCIDELPEDNTFQFQFRLSDSSFQKEIGITNFANAPLFEFNELPKWEWGNFYFVNKGKDLIASSITFGYIPDFGKNNEDDDVVVKLFKFNEKKNDRKIESDELTLVGNNTYTFSPENKGGRLTIPLFSPNSKLPIQLEDETEYFAVVEYVPHYDDSGLRIFANDTMYYDANNYATKKIDKERHIAALKKGNDNFYSLDCFDYPMVPMIRLNVKTIVKASDIVEDQTLNVFPNPAAEAIQVTSFEQEISNIKVQNMLGQTLLSMPFAAKIDVSSLANGVYNLIFETQKGLIIRKINISK